jgi:hypothetical protein
MARRGFFDRPLWRIIIPILLVSFAAHGVASLVLLDAAGGPRSYTALYLVEIVLALAAAAYIFLGYPKRHQRVER